MPPRQSTSSGKRARPGDALAAATAAERLGDSQRALALLLDAVRKHPREAALFGPLARLMSPMRFGNASAAVAEAATVLIRSPWVDPQPLAPAALSILKARHGFKSPMSPDLREDPLLAALLERTLLPDPDLESVLIAERRALLEIAQANDAPSADSKLASFAVSLARQALLNGWMWAETDDEAAGVGRLAESIGATPRMAFAHIVYGLYRPLTTLPNAEKLSQRAKAPWADAATTLIAEPLEERRLAARLPCLTDAVTGDGHKETTAVRAQYEAYPYPRWATIGRRRPQPIREAAKRLFPERVTDAWPVWPTNRVDVLIAGCGAGKHAADVANRFLGIDLTAVDLSRTALGYAARMLRKAPAVTFAEADIMALGGLDRRFHHIESVGVLHHLADPLAGWRNLAGLLHPGGSMRVGFYSKRGRTRIDRARTAMRAAGFHGTDDDNLRRARAFALAAEDSEPAALARGELDFYAASGARDFLFHAHEVEYRPGELAEMVEALGFQVLGLELTDLSAADRYRKMFPDDAVMADLRRWDDVEAEAPDIFRHMCQFWVATPTAAQ